MHASPSATFDLATAGFAARFAGPRADAGTLAERVEQALRQPLGYPPLRETVFLGDRVTLADFEYSGWLTEANHLGNVAYRVGKRIEWDADNLRCRNAPDAARLIRREYRKGWEL